MSLISTSDRPNARPPPSWKQISLNPSAMIPRISWSLAPVLRASNNRCAYAGEVHGQSSEPSVVGRADRRGVPEPGPRLHRDPGRGCRLLLPALAHLRLFKATTVTAVNKLY